MIGSAARSDDRITEFNHLLDGRNDIVLVGVFHRYENRSLVRKADACGDQGLAESKVEFPVNSHDFASALHFRSENGIGTREPGEGEDGLFYGDMVDGAVNAA